MGDVFVELFVLFIGDFRLVRVHSACALLIFSQEITVSPLSLRVFRSLPAARYGRSICCDGTHAPVIEELVFAFTQMQVISVPRSSLVMSATVYSPSPPIPRKHRFLVFRLPREYARSFVGHYKRRVETNTKLTDQLVSFAWSEPRDSRNDLVPDLA